MRVAWSESYLGVYWTAQHRRFPEGDSEDSDQVERIHKLIWVFCWAHVLRYFSRAETRPGFIVHCCQWKVRTFRKRQVKTHNRYINSYCGMQNCSRWQSYFFLLFCRENNAWRFKWKIQSYFLWKNRLLCRQLTWKVKPYFLWKKKKKKKKCIKNQDQNVASNWHFKG